MKTNQISGLCVSCSNAPDCVFLKNAVRPVLECGEFDPILKTDSNKTEIKDSRLESVEPAAREYNGLCRICDKRHDCEYVKNQIIIWHCEEYE